MKILIIILSLLVILAPAGAQISVGDSALDFYLPDTAGTFYSLNDFAGKIIIFNFFASWCPPCQVEAPQLESEIWQAYRDRGVVVVGMDFQEILFPLINFIREKNLTYPILRDTSGSIFQAYGLSIFPSNIVVGRDGRIVLIEAGFNIPLLVGLIDSLVTVSGIEDAVRTGAAPQYLQLLGAYPNPFNPRTAIRIRLLQSGNVSLRVYDITGRTILTRKQQLAAGEHRLNLSMNSYSSGLYFYTVQSGKERLSGRMVLRK